MPDPHTKAHVDAIRAMLAHWSAADLSTYAALASIPVAARSHDMHHKIAHYEIAHAQLVRAAERHMAQEG